MRRGGCTIRRSWFGARRQSKKLGAKPAGTQFRLGALPVRYRHSHSLSACNLSWYLLRTPARARVRSGMMRGGGQRPLLRFSIVAWGKRDYGSGIFFHEIVDFIGNRDVSMLHIIRLSNMNLAPSIPSSGSIGGARAKKEKVSRSNTSIGSPERQYIQR